MLKLDRTDARRILVGVRFVLATVSWLAPSLLHRTMKIKGSSKNATAYPLRLFGVRDAFSGAALVLTDGEEQDRLVALNVAADLADVVASGVGGVTGNLSRRGAALCCIAGLIGASLGSAALGRGPLTKESPPLRT
jgi:hypothetical protein